jgi:CDP-paratose 2-epimerase
MSVVVVTGSAGLIGSEASDFFAKLGYTVVGIENDMRSRLFGKEASTSWNQQRLKDSLGKSYRHVEADIRDTDAINNLFASLGKEVKLIVHTAAQPSHDWAARDPHADFSINATGTLNMLEATRQHCPEAAFIFTSTNKVYGDTPNRLPLIEGPTRWEIDAAHPFHKGIDESMSIDQTLHSVFGSSKVAADVLVQEYGRYFQMNTVAFRGGCLTGPNHSGTALHGFLAYLMKCAYTGREYTVFGYHGKQVRDNIHSADLISCFNEYFQAPRSAEVYNIGGGRFSNASMQEAIALCESITGRPMNHSYKDENRVGDHIWWVSDTSKFAQHYPNWVQKYNVTDILQQIYDNNHERWSAEEVA